jgi:hypothetical protein
VSRDLLNQPEELAERLHDSAEREGELRQTISNRWAYVRALSMRNFDMNAKGRIEEAALLESVSSVNAVH